MQVGGVVKPRTMQHAFRGAWFHAGITRTTQDAKPWLTSENLQRHIGGMALPR
jgi:hypothetical protein